MADTSEPDGSTEEPKPIFAPLKCPNCGRFPAIVFPLIREDHQSVGKAPLVCLDCCLEVCDRI